MRKFVIGSVPYVNAVPLTYRLTTPEGSRYAVVRYAPPSVLAQWLSAGEVDVALVSSVEHFRRPETRFIPGLAIASEREVLSVRLFSKVPIDQIRTVALDTSSLTSSALVRILLQKVFRISPHYSSMPPNLNAMLAEHDSALLIGDAGMLADSTGLVVLDLGSAWYDWTGLPFVWALWLANADADIPALTDLLQSALAWGEHHLGMLIAHESERTGIPYALCERYLREVMVYRIDERFLKGLERFRTEWQTVSVPNTIASPNEAL